MNYFVSKDSVVRRIWGSGDTILFIFAGSSAEFALNKAVDWLYFTGRLPAAPLARLFSTVAYARRIVFSEEAAALATIDTMATIHAGVEAKRGRSIPDWAYRDVLFMLIDYSIRAFEVLERELSVEEKTEVFEVFHRVGSRMGVTGLPTTYQQWQVMREEHLQQDLEKSHYTTDLYRQYKKHLGGVRYLLLVEAQKMVVPDKIKQLLGLGPLQLLSPVLAVYKLSRKLRMDWLLKAVILPRAYLKEIKDLDRRPVL
ncbi:oxygenase MpaB family protein [Pontibacter beigongshangensis]|uniref:oxygenase MpaB family protein n=1 Tax=Pontibacter beigongshangensis TaxID=2574733 RepID=UPI00165080C2|nr:oxygenase MpaB family protein [Pontibacter beigongshangensis]